MKFFKTIPEDVLTTFYSQKVPQGEFVFNEGEEPESVFLLKSGLVKTVKYTSQAEPSTIDFVVPGQMFGMIAVMDSENYPVSAVAIRDSEVSHVPAGQFQDLLNRFIDFRREVFRQVGNHLRNSQVLRTLMQEPVDRRIAHILKYLHDRMGPEIRLSREDIAAMAGCTESTAVRSLIQFRKQKVIQTGWKKFKIISPEKLEVFLS